MTAVIHGRSETMVARLIRTTPPATSRAATSLTGLGKENSDSRIAPSDYEEAARLRGLFASGAEGARTPDLRHAMAALSQLSYSPEGGFRGKSYRGSLIVPGRLEAQVDIGLALDVLDRHREDLVDLGGVDGEQVDFGRGVRGPQVAPGRRQAACADMGGYAAPLAPPPLALHPPQVMAGVEHQVVPSAFDERTQHENAKPHRVRGDGRLGHGPFLARRELAHGGNTGSPTGRPRTNFVPEGAGLCESRS